MGGRETGRGRTTKAWALKGPGEDREETDWPYEGGRKQQDPCEGG
jgi:hypothetical protein